MDIGAVVMVYARAWNDADADARRRWLERAWADDGTYADPTASADGRDALLAHIEKFRDDAPGVRIEMRSAIDEHGRNFRFEWAAVDADGNDLVHGVDFGQLADDGRIGRIVGFFGPRPASASP